MVSPGPSNPAPQRGRSGGLSPLGGRRCGAPMVGSPSWRGRGDGSPRPPRRGDRSILYHFSSFGHLWKSGSHSVTFGRCPLHNSGKCLLHNMKIVFCARRSFPFTPVCGRAGARRRHGRARWWRRRSRARRWTRRAPRCGARMRAHSAVRVILVVGASGYRGFGALSFLKSR